jgi:hypothetical protein
VRRAQSRKRILRLLPELRRRRARVFGSGALGCIQLFLVNGFQHLHFCAHFFQCE